MLVVGGFRAESHDDLEVVRSPLVLQGHELDRSFGDRAGDQATEGILHDLESASHSDVDVDESAPLTGIHLCTLPHGLGASVTRALCPDRSGPAPLPHSTGDRFVQLEAPAFDRFAVR
jgi:hypothetical protein